MLTSAANTAITAVYGTIFLDNFIRSTSTPNPTGVSWTRSIAVVTVTSTAHGLTTGDIIQVSNSSVPAGAINGLASVSVTDSNIFTYTGVNSGTASGTLDYRVNDSRLSILMNEKNADTTNYYTVGSVSAGLTGAGTLSQPTIGDNRTWETPDYIIGYDSFPNILPLIYNLTNAQAQSFDLTYDLDVGSGFSGTFKNLAYNRTGAGGTSGTTGVTMTDTTGVSANDFIYGTGIADGAYVVSVTNSTTIVVSANNTGTVSGTLTFNQLPNTATLPSTGFKIKVKLATNATNATPITAINIPLTSTNTTRARLYDQTTSVPVTVRALDSSLAAIQNARVYIKAASGGPLTAGTLIYTGLTDASGYITTTFGYSSSQPVTGWVRKSTSAPFYKQASLAGDIGSTGYSATAILAADS